MTHAGFGPDLVEVFGPSQQDGGPELVQLLTPEGERVEHAEFSFGDGMTADEEAEIIRGFYRDMVLTRRIDTEATALQRHGELGIWAQLLGQEAAQIGAGRALRPQDFVFPTYREHGVAYCRGVDPLNLLGLFRGVDQGSWDPNDNNFGLYTIVIGAQTLHATGYAMGMQRDGDVGTGDPERDAAVIAHFGDGASSQGDVNEAFIFAASYNAPVVFFCQNNQWAISEPIERQTRIPLYQRALGFGFPGVRVDGNDVLATYAVTQAALQRARDGQGPTFVEAYTYRMGAHTTTDDPTRYRLSDDVEHWKLKDPIARVEVYLKRNGLADDDFFEAVQAEADELGHHLREGCKALPDPKPLSMFDHVYAEMTEELAAQRDGFAAYLESFEGSHCMTHRRSRSPRASTWACARRWRTTPRSSSWARTSASSAASSGSPTACRRTSARTASSTPRSPSPASSAPRSAWRCAATGPSSRSSSTGSSTRRTTRSSARSPRCTSAARASQDADGHPDPVRRRHRRGRAPQREPGGAVRAHAGPQGGRLLQPGRRLLDDPAGHRLRRPGDLPRAEAAVPRRQGRARRGRARPSRCSRRGSSAQGTDVTVLAYGPMVKTAMMAAEAAAGEGKSLEVIDLRTLSPLDMGPVYDSVRRTGRAVVTHEAHVNLGMGSEVAARITEECFYSLEAPVLRVGGFDTPYPPSRIEEDFLPDLDRVLDAVDRSLNF